MRKKIKIAGLAIVLLVSSLLIQQGMPMQEPSTPTPYIRPASQVAVSYRDNIPSLLTIEPISKKAIASVETSSTNIHRFIDKIVVGERAEKYLRTAVQEIQIHYRYIGILDNVIEETQAVGNQSVA